MKLKRVGILSLGKTAGLLYSILGLVIGLIYGSMAGVFLSAMMPLMAEADPTMSAFDPADLPTAGIALGMIIGFPILYGLLGFFGGMLVAAIYNFAAKLTGGYELHFESSKEADAFVAADPAVPAV